MSRCLTIVGVQWGDEGKGKITDLLAGDADVVARYQGGANAGHTVVVDGRKIVLHQIPSGILNARSFCVIGPAVVIDPQTIMAEMDDLRNAGWAVDPSRLAVSRSAAVVMPYHKKLDSLREASRTKGKIGTTGRGIGPAYEDMTSRAGIRMADFCDEVRLRERLEMLLPERNAVLKFHGGQEVSIDDMVTWARPLAATLRSYLADTGNIIDETFRNGGSVLFESAQGTLLDVIHGTYPYVTSSFTSAPAAFSLSGIGVHSDSRVLAVVKAYTMRVGEGPFPTEDHAEFGSRLRETGHEFGATTGRPRRCGSLDLPSLRYALRINGVTSIALTKIDVLSGMPSFRVCRAYRVPGEGIVDVLPADRFSEPGIEPVYEEWPGWTEDISSITDFDGLPEQVKAFVSRIETELNVPVDIVSTGSDRNATVIVRTPW